MFKPKSVAKAFTMIGINMRDANNINVVPVVLPKVVDEFFAQVAASVTILICRHRRIVNKHLTTIRKVDQSCVRIP